MFLTELFEAQTPKHASFCFGRMNPPTVGHGQLINTVANSAQDGDYFIFVSKTQDKKKNPLDYQTKINFIKAMFPDQAAHVVHNASLNTIMNVAEWLYNKGYQNVTFVAGSDRLADFKELLIKYNGVEGGNAYYKFNSINFVSSGDRDPDADGITGVSASSAREAASKGDMEAFAQATGAGKLTQPLYDAVRKGMLLEHIVKHGSGYRLLSHKGKNLGTFPTKAAAEKHEREVQYFKHANEDASGYIPKNKKEAKDPRWSNALTVDVHPDTPLKNAKAFKLA